MLALYGSSAADHGAAWCSPGAADAAAVAGSTAAAAVQDMAKRLVQKEQVQQHMKKARKGDGSGDLELPLLGEWSKTAAVATAAAPTAAVAPAAAAGGGGPSGSG